MRATTAIACAVLLVLVAGCGDDEPKAGATKGDLVVARRAATAAEHDRIDDDGEPVLGCTGEGGPIWDYGAIGPDDPRGRTPDDALRDAIRDINERRTEGGSSDPLPAEGWVQLDDHGQIWFLLADGDEWHALVTVGGDAKLGVWRHNRAIVCP
jgi:hypothetical protein